MTAWTIILDLQHHIHVTWDPLIWIKMAMWTYVKHHSGHYNYKHHRGRERISMTDVKLRVNTAVQICNFKHPGSTRFTHHHFPCSRSGERCHDPCTDTWQGGSTEAKWSLTTKIFQEDLNKRNNYEIIPIIPSESVVTATKHRSIFPSQKIF